MVVMSLKFCWWTQVPLINATKAPQLRLMPTLGMSDSFYLWIYAAFVGRQTFLGGNITLRSLKLMNSGVDLQRYEAFS